MVRDTSKAEQSCEVASRMNEFLVMFWLLRFLRGWGSKSSKILFASICGMDMMQEQWTTALGAFYAYLDTFHGLRQYNWALIACFSRSCTIISCHPGSGKAHRLLVEQLHYYRIDLPTTRCMWSGRYPFWVLGYPTYSIQYMGRSFAQRGASCHHIETYTDSMYRYWSTFSSALYPSVLATFQSNLDPLRTSKIPLIDVAIIGGGPAGLSTASTLARQLHAAVGFDSQVHRNAKYTSMHMVPGWENKDPKDFRASARSDVLANYSTVEFANVGVATIEKKDGAHFIVSDVNGKGWHFRKILLAVGPSNKFRPSPR